MTKEINKIKDEVIRLEYDISLLKSEIARLQKNQFNKFTKLKEAKAKLNKITGQKPFNVSDHAVVRYLDRVMGVDLDELYRKILSDDVLSCIEKTGGEGTFPNKDFKVVMKNNTVVTVLKNE